jgi:hypothetical protein
LLSNGADPSRTTAFRQRTSTTWTGSAFHRAPPGSGHDVRRFIICRTERAPGELAVTVQVRRTENNKSGRLIHAVGGRWIADGGKFLFNVWRIDSILSEWFVRFTTS